MRADPTNPGRKLSLRRSPAGVIAFVLLAAMVAVLAFFAWRELFAPALPPAPSARAAADAAPAAPAASTGDGTSGAPLTSIEPLSSVTAPRRVADPAGEYVEREGFVPWLRFHVVDATTGLPLARAHVLAAATAPELAAQAGATARGIANALGVATLAEPPDGLAGDLPWLLITAERHAPALLPVTGAVPSGTHAFCVRGRTIELPLPRADPVAVHVEAEGGRKPVAGAHVTVRAPWAEEAVHFADGVASELADLLAQELVTDAEGAASFVALARQPLRIRVGALGFDSEERVVTVDEARAGRVDFSLRELQVAAVVVPAVPAGTRASLAWDEEPAWSAPDAIHLAPARLDAAERAAARTHLLDRLSLHAAVRADAEVRFKFATLGAAAFAGPPHSFDVPGRISVLPGDDPLPLLLRFVPFSRFGESALFQADAGGTAGELAHVRMVVKRVRWNLGPIRLEESERSMPLSGTLVRADATDSPFAFKATRLAGGAAELALPAGHYDLSAADPETHGLIVGGFEVVAGDKVEVRLLDVSDLYAPPVQVFDALRRPRLRFAINLFRHERPGFLASRRFSGRLPRHFDLDPFSELSPTAWWRADRDSFSTILFVDPRHDPDALGVGSYDARVEVFGCAPSPEFSFELKMGGPPTPLELTLALDEAPDSAW